MFGYKTMIVLCGLRNREGSSCYFFIMFDIVYNLLETVTVDKGILLILKDMPDNLF